MFFKKANLLTLTLSENYSFGASFDKISSNNNEIYLLKFSNSLGVSKSPEQICMVGKKSRFGV